MTRRRFMTMGATAVGAAGLGFVGYARFWEPRHLRVERTTARIRGIRTERPIRILQLSDPHWSSVVPLDFIGEAITRGLALEPDLILLTGDFITAGSEAELGDYVPVLARAAASAPTYAVAGNHDGGPMAAEWGGFTDPREVTRMLESSGARVLADESIPVDVRETRVTLVGTTDYLSERIDTERAFAGVDPAGSEPVVVLAHNPDTKDLIGDRRWDLMVSGHTHGGQIVLPLLGGCFAPVRDRRYLAGLKPWNGRLVHVSRGIGNLYGVRFNCPPEINLIELRGRA